MTDYLLPASFGALAATLILITAWSMGEHPEPLQTCTVEVHAL